MKAEKVKSNRRRRKTGQGMWIMVVKVADILHHSGAQLYVDATPRLIGSSKARLTIGAQFRHALINCLVQKDSLALGGPDRPGTHSVQVQ